MAEEGDPLTQAEADLNAGVAGAAAELHRQDVADSPPADEATAEPAVTATGE